MPPSNWNWRTDTGFSGITSQFFENFIWLFAAMTINTCIKFLLFVNVCEWNILPFFLFVFIEVLIFLSRFFFFGFRLNEFSQFFPHFISFLQLIIVVLESISFKYCFLFGCCLKSNDCGMHNECRHEHKTTKWIAIIWYYIVTYKIIFFFFFPHWWFFYRLAFAFGCFFSSCYILSESLLPPFLL